MQFTSAARMSWRGSNLVGREDLVVAASMFIYCWGMGLQPPLLFSVVSCAESPRGVGALGAQGCRFPAG